MKIVINKCFGGYSLSKAAYAELGIPWDGYGFALASDAERCDSKLVACVEKLGDRASGMCARLRVIEIPDGVDWEITDYDGHERVEERHQSWE